MSRFRVLVAFCAAYLVGVVTQARDVYDGWSHLFALMAAIVLVWAMAPLDWRANRGTGTDD